MRHIHLQNLQIQSKLISICYKFAQILPHKRKKGVLDLQYFNKIYKINEILFFKYSMTTFIYNPIAIMLSHK